jgi:hypothetical protein
VRFKNISCVGAALTAVFLMAAVPALAAKPELAGQTIPSDQNADRKPDHWESYDSRGVKVLVASDTNLDGKPDYWKHPIRAMMILRERDRNFDGRVDERSVTDFIYDRALKFNRHLSLWRESDDDFNGAIDVYKVRGEALPKPDRRGLQIDPAPWSIAKDAKTNSAKSADAATSLEKTQIDQMNLKQSMTR